MTTTPTPPTGATTTANNLPLSVLQEAMWVAWQLRPDAWEHIVPATLSVRGDLDVERLRVALDDVGRRHPALRGRIAATEDGPGLLSWTDASPVPLTARTVNGRLDEAVALARHRPFDLAEGPLARAELLRDGRAAVLVFATHHIVADGAAMQMLLRDLRRAYNGEDLGGDDERTVLAGHARRSWDLADGPEGEPLRAYWHDQLADAADARTLPGRPPGGPPAFHAVPLDPDLTAALRRTARSTGVTFFTAVLGALFVTLHRHTASDDLIVSTPYHGRRGRALKPLVGSFANILPIRQRLRHTDTYATLLRSLATELRAAIAHGDLPLPAILRAAGLVGPNSRTRTHEAVLTHWNETQAADADLRDLRFTGDRGDAVLTMTDATSASDYRLTVLLEEASTGCRLTWQDPGHTIGPDLLATMARDHLAVLADLATDPARSPGTLLPPQATPHDEEPTASPPPARTASHTAAHPDGTPAHGERPETADAIARIWSDVLGVPAVTAEDSFFALGGHSLLATTVVNRMRAELGQDIAVRDLFGHPVVGDLAGVVDGRRATGTGGPDAAGPGRPTTHTGTCPASRFQEGIWLAARLDPDHARYRIPLLWHTEGDIDADRLEQALALLVSRHEILRTRFTDREGRLFQEPTEAWTPEVERRDLTGVREEDREQWIRKWSDTAVDALDPSRGHLVRAGLFRTGDGTGVLALCTHHLVLDGESVPVLLRELERCYDTVTGGPPAQPPRHQYRDLVAAQSAAESGTEPAYWRRRLTGAPASLDVPAPARPGPDGGTVLALPEPTARALMPVRIAHKASTFMIGATAVAAVLHRWTGRTDLTFGIPVALRGTLGMDDVLGPCVNTLVLRSRCEERTTLAGLLDAVREEMIAAFEHQTMPYEDVVRQLRPPRRAGRAPYVDVMVNNVAPNDWTGRLGRARLTPVDFVADAREVSKFPLTFTFSQSGGAVRGTLAHRGDSCTAAQARELAGRVADVLARFADLLGTSVLDLGPTAGRPAR